MLTSVVMQVVKLLLKFISRTAVIHYLGIAYAGIDSVFSNVLTLLSVTELGIGTAIIFDMYRPIALDDREQIRALVGFYRVAYCVIGCVVMGVGLAIIPLLPILVNVPEDVPVNIYLVYVAFLANTAGSYFFAYKRSVLQGYQKNYTENIIKSVCTILANLAQIVCLAAFRNFYIYVLILIAQTVAENISVVTIVNRNYPFVKGHLPILEKAGRRRILTNTAYIFANTVSSAVLTGTDTLLLSAFFGVVYSGRYGNYTMISAGVATFIGYYLVSFTGGIGNKIAKDSKKEVFRVYQKLRALFNFANVIMAVCLAVLFNDFIGLWAGEENVLSPTIMLLCVANCYCMNHRNFIRVFKNTSGQFDQFWWIYAVEAFINLVVSILLAKVLGPEGVLLGTMISYLLTTFWAEPLVVYKRYFSESLADYFINYLLGAAAALSIGFFLTKYIGSFFVCRSRPIFFLKAVVIGALAALFSSVFVFANKDWREWIKSHLRFGGRDGN